MGSSTTWKKGQSGNPWGKPKGARSSITSVLRDKLEEIPEGQNQTYKELLVETILHKGLVEKDIHSLKLIINYVDGLPKQEIDLNNRVINIDDLPDKEFQNIIKGYNGTIEEDNRINERSENSGGEEDISI